MLSKTLNRLLPLWVAGFAFSLQAASPQPLFNGKTFANWEGNTNEWWRIESGAIVGGSLEKHVPHNDFIATTGQFTNFIFKTQFKLLGTEGFINSGIQIRSQRVPNSHEMAGYQCDIGDPTWWGSIYDESRRNKVMAQSNMEAINKVLKRGDWNDFTIRAEGRRIRTYINGVLGVDYTEPDTTLPQWGRIGFQVHGGGKAECWFKDVTIEILPPTRESPLTPQEQQASFEVPEGFEIELVASEPQLPKPVMVTWDDQGRLWAVTALEYPVDGNENLARAEALFAKGGRDKILVFDHPERPGPLQPRVFADGLAMPLGVLPYKDGAYVQYGHEILFLRDSDGDGKADQREVILSGFGIQDSHLFPHQLTRAPGGWIYLAQGAFNYSRVKTTTGMEIQFDQTKLARFRPDGSVFEVLTFGPCNIWGLVINQFGETFIQEANDYGYPVIPYQPGINVPGCGSTKFRPYAPHIPVQAEFRMGGTSLSGLALSEDPSQFPEPWHDVMFVANPIPRQVQAVKIHRGYPSTTESKLDQNAIPNGYHLERLPDFVSSSDEWFRPVAIHFGPDGCLYIVDWYNKIISHNEVPRNHPDRDKTRGRLWRVRHTSQKFAPIPNIAQAPNHKLTQHLQSLNPWEWRAALNQIEERQPQELVSSLRSLAEKPKAKKGSPGFQSSLAIRALWALENLNRADLSLLQKLSRSGNRNVRREALRAAGNRLSRSEAIQLAAPLAQDPDHQVRTEVIRTVSGQVTPWHHLVRNGQELLPPRNLVPDAITTLVSMAHPPLPRENQSGPGYDRALERYLIRAALENDPDAIAIWLSSTRAAEFPADNRRLACSVLNPSQAARHLAKLMAQDPFQPSEEEWLTLHRHRQIPEVGASLNAFSPYPHDKILQAALHYPYLIQPASDEPWLTESVNLLLQNQADRETSPRIRRLAIESAGSFKLTGTEPGLLALLSQDKVAPDLQLASLQTLTAFKSQAALLFYDIAIDPDRSPEIRQQALQALAVCPHPDAAEKLLSLWPTLLVPQRSALLHKLASSKTGSLKILTALKRDLLTREELPVPLLQNMRTLLPDNPDMQVLWDQISTSLKQVLALQGGQDDFVRTEINLSGDFTIETWIKLAPGIGNEDGILGNPGSVDLNFYGGKFRFYGGPGIGDVVVAERSMTPEVWTHLAVTRDDQGKIQIFVNGELDGTGARPFTEDIAKLDLGRTTPAGKGTDGQLTEFRVWNIERTAGDIRLDFDRSYSGNPVPAGLVHYFPGEGPWGGPLVGQARIQGVLNTPSLLTEAEAMAQRKSMDHFRGLALASGKVGPGQALFETLCLTCHQVNGQGSTIAPPLDGVGLRDTDGLLRAILTPNAAMEGGYRSFQVLTRDDEIYDGFLVSQDASGVLLRQPNAGDLRIPTTEIKRAGFRNVSLMPEGLLEAMTPEQISDLFAYLTSLK